MKEIKIGSKLWHAFWLMWSVWILISHAEDALRRTLELPRNHVAAIIVITIDLAMVAVGAYVARWEACRCLRRT